MCIQSLPQVNCTIGNKIVIHHLQPISPFPYQECIIFSLVPQVNRCFLPARLFKVLEVPPVYHWVSSYILPILVEDLLDLTAEITSRFTLGVAAMANQVCLCQIGGHIGPHYCGLKGLFSDMSRHTCKVCHYDTDLPHKLLRLFMASMRFQNYQ